MTDDGMSPSGIAAVALLNRQNVTVKLHFKYLCLLQEDSVIINYYLFFFLEGELQLLQEFIMSQSAEN